MGGSSPRGFTRSNLTRHLNSTRRDVLRYGAAGGAAMAASSLTGVPSFTAGPFKIALSNAYNGNEWRRQHAAAFEQAANEMKAQGHLQRIQRRAWLGQFGAGSARRDRRHDPAGQRRDHDQLLVRQPGRRRDRAGGGRRDQGRVLRRLCLIGPLAQYRLRLRVVGQEQRRIRRKAPGRRRQSARQRADRQPSLARPPASSSATSIR